MIKAYLAGSIFFIGDKLRNEYFCQKLRSAIPNIDIYNPLENEAINDKTKFASSLDIAEADCARLNASDILIACIDSDVLPAGTCAEIGIMYEKIANGQHKLVVGICTDTRQQCLTHSHAKDMTYTEPGENQYCYENLFVTGIIKKSGVLVTNIDDAIDEIKRWLERTNQ